MNYGNWNQLLICSPNKSLQMKSSRCKVPKSHGVLQGVSYWVKLTIQICLLPMMVFAVQWHKFWWNSLQLIAGRANRKILEELEEQKKRLRMQAQGPPAAASPSTLPTAASYVSLWVHLTVIYCLYAYICYITIYIALLLVLTCNLLADDAKLM